MVLGHSLGAAVGTIAMFTLQDRGFTVQQSYIFESPRIGNVAFASAFASHFHRDVPVFRISNQRDPVVHLQPAGQPDMWSHVRSEVYYYPSYNTSEYVVCENAEDNQCAGRYSLADTLAFGRDHCASSLAVGGNICEVPASFCSPSDIL